MSKTTTSTSHVTQTTGRTPLNRQRTGGVAAVLSAGTFVVGMAVFLGVLIPAGYFDATPTQKVVILAEYQTIASVSYLASFVLFGLLLVLLALALHERLRTGAPLLTQTATVFGLIWAALVIASGMVANVGIGTVVSIHATDPAQAGTAWLAIESIQLGLGGGNEIVGGTWVLLISWAALRARELPRVLNYLGITIGVSGLLTVIPAFELLGAVEALGAVFGVGLVAWFTWLGLVMLRTDSAAVRAETR